MLCPPDPCCLRSEVRISLSFLTATQARGGPLICTGEHSTVRFTRSRFTGAYQRGAVLTTSLHRESMGDLVPARHGRSTRKLFAVVFGWIDYGYDRSFIEWFHIFLITPTPQKPYLDHHSVVAHVAGTRMDRRGAAEFLRACE